MSFARELKRRQMKERGFRTKCKRCRAELFEKWEGWLVCPECGWELQIKAKEKKDDPSY